MAFPILPHVDLSEIVTDRCDEIGIAHLGIRFLSRTANEFAHPRPSAGTDKLSAPRTDNRKMKEQLSKGNSETFIKSWHIHSEAIIFH